MKCIKAIKETSQYEVGRIMRVEDKVADQRVSTGYWKFIPKNEWKEDVYQNKLPVFEFQSTQHFPFEETLIPMAKRKLLSYILQSVSKEKLENFDNLKIVS